MVGLSVVVVGDVREISGVSGDKGAGMGTEQGTGIHSRSRSRGPGAGMPGAITSADPCPKTSHLVIRNQYHTSRLSKVALLGILMFILFYIFFVLY